MQHLTKLVLAKNALKALPAYVAAVTCLADLDISDNPLTTLPPGRFLGACRALPGQRLMLACACPVRKPCHSRFWCKTATW